VYAANFYDKRYTPSLVQQELVDGGLLGRKSGHGFYDYSEDRPLQTPDFPPQHSVPASDDLSVHGAGAIAGHIGTTLGQHDCPFEAVTDSDWIGLQAGNAQLRLGDGRCAAELGRDIAVFDLSLRNQAGGALAWSHAARASAQWIEDAPRWLALFGYLPQQIKDVPGLVVARTIAMLINEAADAVQQGVCDVVAADAAMKLGVNYPAGPFEWLADWDIHAVIELLDRLDAHYRGERYRVSPWLRLEAWREGDA